MTEPFEETPLWRRTLGADDPHGEARGALRAAYHQFRTAVTPLAAEIGRSLPMFTDHSIAHADALWDTASLICGDDFPLNPAEAFVLGGAFLLHDLGMGLACFPRGVAAIEEDPRFGDLLAGAMARADEPADRSRAELQAREQVIAELLRLGHAERGEALVTEVFHTSAGEPFHLLADPQLRHDLGSLIGRVAHSHWWDVADLVAFEQRQGSCVGHPPEWDVDPLKIACVLRLADAAHIDQRRAPLFLHAFRRPTGVSRDHWHFQERLTRPRAEGDRLVYTASRPFGRSEAGAWWLAQETIRGIDEELRRVDALCADLGRPRFRVRSVAGADSPERLARYIHTDRWEPIDAKLRVSDPVRLVANLGGEDLYGQKPEVAVRELIANATDATRARHLFTDEPAAPVVVRLSEEDGQWWLTVSDQGIGMSRETMVSALTDFGCSRWRSPEILREYPGLVARGFESTGRFGIGFFAVFMVADQVQVRSLAYGEALARTHVLEFPNGVAGRPLLRLADPDERLRTWGTVVRLKLRADPRSEAGLFKTSRRDLTHTQFLHGRLRQLCALSDVDIVAQGPDDPVPAAVVGGGDWTSIPAAELFRRLYWREEEGQLDRMLMDGYEKLFSERATIIRDSAGTPCGRAVVATGWESVYPDMYWLRVPEAHVFVGGLRGGTIDYCLGAFVGEPLTADRLRAFPQFDFTELHRWLETQADQVMTSGNAGSLDRWMVGHLVRGFGAEGCQLPVGHAAEPLADRADLVAWLTARDEVLLVSEMSFNAIPTFDPRVLFQTFDGREVLLPGNVLVVPLNPPWYFPEEVLPRPRDERFAAAPPSLTGWNPRAWWHDTGNFGTPGLVVRTIAEAWGIDVVDVVSGMEALFIDGDRDLRPRLPTMDGGSVRATAIRIRRSDRE